MQNKQHATVASAKGVEDLEGALKRCSKEHLH